MALAANLVLLNFFLILSSDIEKDVLLYTSHTWLQLKTEQAQNITGLGQRASRIVLVVMKASKSLKWPLRADGEVPGPLRLTPTVTHSPITCTSVPVFSIPYFCSFGLHGWTNEFT